MHFIDCSCRLILIPALNYLKLNNQQFIPDHYTPMAYIIIFTPNLVLSSA